MLCVPVVLLLCSYIYDDHIHTGTRHNDGNDSVSRSEMCLCACVVEIIAHIN